jgi:hypothetical protein
MVHLPCVVCVLMMLVLGGMAGGHWGGKLCCGHFFGSHLLNSYVRHSSKLFIYVDSTKFKLTPSPESPPCHRLISAFYRANRVLMVLNTSFNMRKGKPILKPLRDAIRSFLSLMGTIKMLMMGGYVNNNI